MSNIMAIDTIHEESSTSEIAINSIHEETPQEHRQGSKLPFSKRPQRRHGSSEIESGHRHHHHHHHGHSKDGNLGVILQLAFQSIGVVYGDIGTSPLYVYSSTFNDGIKHNDDILGVLSLIFYTLTLIPLIKYVFVVLRATDNGDGGTFALYSLVCRHAKVSLIPDQGSDEDREASTFEVELPKNPKRRASKLESRLEKSNVAKFSMLLATMLGTSMVIGDGVLTPCISVLSAVGGIKQATSTMTEDRIVWVSIAILVFLFMIQRFGTDKVGYSFAPIIFVWFCFIAGTGIFNFIKYDPYVLKALNPQYIVNYFTRNKEKAWISLGGVVLCTTGAEALFADVGHFSVRSIQVSMCALTYPALVLAYVGQASFLRKNEHLAQDAFYKSIPGPMFWPMFVVAVLASIIASQAMISGTFSIIQQSLSLGCFPRVKVVHTSTKYQGQVYIPEINFLLMLASLAVTLGFRTTERIGNAYGIAVVFVMTLTSAFLVLIMILIWETHILIVISYILVIVTIELVYLSSVLYKFGQGGYLPLGFASFLMAVMYIWHHVHRKTCNFELNNKISPESIKDIMAATAPQRLSGLAIFYSKLVRGIPPIFRHYATNIPVLHSVLIFVSVESLPVRKVPVRDRFLVCRVEPRNLRVFRCIVRYGYTDARDEHEPFEDLLVEKVREFIEEEYRDELSEDDRFCGDDGGDGNGEERKNMARMEMEDLDRAQRCGVVHLVGEHEVAAERGANLGKRIVINYAYSFLKRNFRQSNEVFDIPSKRMLKVGMIYEI